MIDADRLVLALRRVADSELRFAIAVAGGSVDSLSTLRSAGAGRVTTSISADGDITVAVIDHDGQPSSMTALMADLKSAMPAAFKTAAMNIAAPPPTEHYSLAEWQDTIANADDAQRAELLRRSGAGEIEVSA